MGEDILSVIFLVLICIVIAAIARRLAPSGMQVPTFALIAVCLWIAFDYMLLKRYKAKLACSEQKSERKNISRMLNVTQPEPPAGQAEQANPEPQPQQANPEPPADSNQQQAEQATQDPQAKHKNEFDIDLYDKKLPIETLFKDTGSAGDTRMANRMKYMGLQARMSQDIRSRWNVEKYRPYFTEELSANENRDWWDVENEELDLLM